MIAGHEIAVAVLLAIAIVSCWAGTFGMLMMKEPIEAIHYIAIPVDIGMVVLTCAVFLEKGFSQAGIKCLVILLVLLASNSIGTHAAARAFRARKLGHWKPEPKDDVEFLGGKPRS